MFKKVVELKYTFDADKRQIKIPQKIMRKDLLAIIAKDGMVDIYRKGDRLTFRYTTLKSGVTQTTLKFPDEPDYDYIEDVAYGGFLFEVPDAKLNQEEARRRSIASAAKKVEREEKRKQRALDMAERKKKAEERKKNAEIKRQMREQLRTSRQQQRAVDVEQEKTRAAEQYRRSYSGARQIANKSLLDLTLTKWSNGQGLASSAGSAIADKFVGKMTRIKRAFDPLNWVSKLLGSVPLVGGGLQKIGVTALGALFGRSRDAIEEFGGYARSKKDTKHTKLGAGQVRNLETGDSSVDILAKMYNFMVKDYERQKKERELENDFRKEQQDEAERRHKKLVEAIHDLTGGKKSDGEKPKDESKNFIDMVMGGIKSVIDTVTKFANFVKSIFTTAFGAIKLMAGPLAMVIKEVAGLLFKSIEGIIGKVVTSTMLLFTAFFSKKMKAVTTLLSAVFEALSSIGGKIFSTFLSGRAKILGAAALALYEYGPNLISYIRNEEPDKLRTERSSVVGKESESGFEKYYAEKRKLEDIQVESTISSNPDEFLRVVKYEERMKKNEDLRNKAIADALTYQRSVMIPKIAEILSFGRFEETTPEMTKDGYPLLRFKSPLLGEHNIADMVSWADIYGSATNLKDMALQEGSKLFNEQMKEIENSESWKKLGDFTSDATLQLKSISEDVLKTLPKKEDEPDEDMDTDPQFISMNTTNNIGGKAKYSDTTPISPRIKNDSIQLALARTSYVV